jgi:hypothetical protein
LAIDNIRPVFGHLLRRHRLGDIDGVFINTHNRNTPPCIPGSVRNTALWPSFAQACAIPTELSAGPKAASGKNAIT